jgi:hypothetical protein
MDGVADWLRRTGGNTDSVETGPTGVVKAVANVDRGKRGGGIKAGDGFVSPRSIAKLQDVSGGRHGVILALRRWFCPEDSFILFTVQTGCRIP